MSKIENFGETKDVEITVLIDHRADRIPGTLGYFATFVALGLATAALGPTLPDLAEHTKTHLSEISLIFTAHALGYLLGSFQGGRLYDRVRGHPVMAAGLLTIVAMLALVPLISHLWLLVLVMLVMGMASGAVDVGGNTLLVWSHGRKVGPFMNGLHFCWGLGSFLAPIIIAQAVRMSGDITWAYWLLALLVVPAAVWLLRLPSPAAHSAPNEEPEAQPRSAAFDKLFVVLIASLLFLYAGAGASFGGWIFTYATGLNLAGQTTAALLTSVYWGSLALGRLLAIPLAVRVHPRSTLFSALGGCLASVGVILLRPASQTALWLGTFGLGLSMATIFPTAISLAERHLAITGRITGWFFVGASAGGMTLPWLIGQLFEARGPRVMMVSILVALAMALGILALLTYNSRRR